MLRSLVRVSIAAVCSLAATSASAQTTFPYDHVHVNVPDPAAASAWYEKNFGGKRITEAILAKQYPALQSYVAIIAIFYVVINFIIDILYSVLDPRIRNARAVA